MGTFTAGSVVVVTFPFSDLSHSKLRPAVVLASAGRNDWILCQVTSKPYSDPKALKLTDASFDQGSLRLVSYARPSKLFTANDSIIRAQVGVLNKQTYMEIVDIIVKLLYSNIPTSM